MFGATINGNQQPNSLSNNKQQIVN